MQCPMMSAMKNLKLHADNPVVLLAMKEQLDLSEEQAKQLDALVSDVRERAKEILSDQQQQQIAQAPQGPLSMMQVMMLLRQQPGDQREQGQMCPMCIKMMRERMEQNRPGQAAGKHEEHHSESERPR